MNPIVPNETPAAKYRERDFLRGVLKMAKRWHLFADEVGPLSGGENVGRALLAEEKLKLLKTAASKPEWHTARHAMILALCTTMRGCELRALRGRDLDFLERTVTVRRSKTEAGKRVIPLNADAWDAILELRDRCKRLFGDSRSPDWHMFPHAEGFSRPDATQLMWRGGWRLAEHQPLSTQYPTSGRSLPSGMPGLVMAQTTSQTSHSSQSRIRK